MLNWIKKKIINNSKLVENISYLTLLQVFTTAIPIITFPYLVRVLGNELYGTVIYVQVIMSYFSLIIDCGFRNSAAKDVSIHRDDKEKLSEIISSILTVRIILWIVLFILLVISVYTFQGLNDLKYLYIFSFGYTLNELLLPQFYFLGMERMKYMTVLNVTVKGVFILLMFVLIREKNDYLMVPLLYTLGFLIGGGIGLYIIFVNDKIRFKFQSFTTIKNYVAESFPLLATSLVASIKDKFSVILIGGYLGMTEVAIYDLGMKIVVLLLKPIEIINTAFFPNISKSRDISKVKNLLKSLFVLTLIVTISIQLPLDYIVNLLSDGKMTNITPIRILLLIPLLMSISLTLARNVIIALGYYKSVFKIMLLSSLVYISLVLLAVLTNNLESLIIFVSIALLAYLFELIFRLFEAYKIYNHELERMD